MLRHVQTYENRPNCGIADSVTRWSSDRPLYWQRIPDRYSSLQLKHKPDRTSRTQIRPAGEWYRRSFDPRVQDCAEAECSERQTDCPVQWSVHLETGSVDCRAVRVLWRDVCAVHLREYRISYVSSDADAASPKSCQSAEQNNTKLWGFNVCQYVICYLNLPYVAFCLQL